MAVVYRPIGIIHTPFQDVGGMPVQPTKAAGIRGEIEIFPEFVPGLGGLDGFSHIVLLYHLHRVREPLLTVVPFMATEPRGVFATRSPRRPNPIGLSIVRLRAIAGATLQIENVDMLDGTPLLDIKPFFPALDCPGGECVG